MRWALKPIPERSNKELDLTIRWCDEVLLENESRTLVHTRHTNYIKKYRANALVERTERFMNGCKGSKK
ncbi:hypothetical protein PQC38_gp076 [Aeromonas phage BUCT695]|uniref:hypothetical protein n=1 Tax=Aeromonas phage BUCT695 TaxID=2908630 RepID=UPI0023290559|nr:hypothetical protein PQC38_gp076 [Aeromonas phage BUCT695]UIW10552.1 hypothetical protein [Aeromonas phage BUCT695]